MPASLLSKVDSGCPSHGATRIGWIDSCKALKAVFDTQPESSPTLTDYLLSSVLISNSFTHSEGIKSCCRSIFLKCCAVGSIYSLFTGKDEGLESAKRNVAVPRDSQTKIPGGGISAFAIESTVK